MTTRIYSYRHDDTQRRDFERGIYERCDMEDRRDATPPRPRMLARLQDMIRFARIGELGEKYGERDIQELYDCFAASETAMPDSVKELCAHIKDSIRLCDHGYIHITCGACTGPWINR